MINSFKEIYPLLTRDILNESFKKYKIDKCERVTILKKKLKPFRGACNFLKKFSNKELVKKKIRTILYDMYNFQS